MSRHANAIEREQPVEVVPWSAALEQPLRQFVEGHDHGLIYYTPRFRQFLLSVLGPDCKCDYRIAMRGGLPTGILPLLTRNTAFGTVINSLPFFGSNGGVLASDAASEAALRSEYERLSRAQDVACATWIEHPFVEQGAPPHDFEDERIAQWTALPDNGDADALAKVIESSARRNAQKAERQGVTVEETPDELMFTRAAHRANIGAIGGRTKPDSFFEMLPRDMAFGRDWTLYVARHDGRPIASLLLFMCGRTVEYIMPAIGEGAREVQPTAALLMRAMTDAMRRGARLWNWGGTWLTQDNVYRFKRKWGASERRYRYLVSVNDRSILSRTQDELAAAAPFFFTVPYSLLEGAGQ